jgi:phosphoglycolate phosphatase
MPAGNQTSGKDDEIVRTLVLFDIDGTLVAGGPAKGAFHHALLSVYGEAGPIDAHEFSGKTDPQIARELLRLGGLEEGAIDGGFPRLWEVYLAELETRLQSHPVTVLPGVAPLVEALDARGDVAVGLVTGNILGGARLKLTSGGLPTWAVGAFGSDHEFRNELPGIALRRASDAWGVTFSPDRVVVVGDTPRDVECGRHHGTRTVGVATGNFTADVLAAAGATRVLQTFEDLDETLAAFLGG